MSIVVPAELREPRGGRFSRALATAGRALATELDAEQGRWFLWIPVFFGAGVGAYFALPAEPDLSLSGGLLLLALSLRILARTQLFAFLLTTIVLCASAGFFAAKVRTAIVAAPVLERHGAYSIEGVVEQFDRQTEKRARAIIRLSSLKYDDAEMRARPFRVRVSLRGDVDLRPGEAIRFRAILGPPPEPVMPGGYDFARASYYQAIGGSGYSLTKPEKIEGGALPWDMVPRTWLADLRGRIGERIKAALPGQTGEIAAALTVGQTAGLDEKSMDDLRASGLAHIISISGMHMSLVAGGMFWFVRWVLALFPSIALRYSTRGLAAMAALFVVTVYLALSGAAVGAVRAYLMIAVVFLAILLNRPALSLRNVALAGLVILVVLPDSLIDISFQMSFAATAALIAGYERFGRYLHFEARNIRERLAWQPVYLLGGVLVTTATAGLAVEPFSAYHFHTLTTYAALGNLVGAPPVDFIAMPAMIVALIAMPFGLEDAPLAVMGVGVDAMMAVAHWVGGLPGSTVPVAAFPFAALLLIVSGGLWLVIWRRSWRVLGLGLIGVGVAMTSIHARPDILVDRDAKLVAVRDREGRLQAPKTRRASYALQQWLRADGDTRKPKEAATGAGWQCDRTSCVSMVKARLVSLIARPDAIEEDCRRAAILVMSMDLARPCPAPKLVLDRGALWERGAAAISLGDGAMAVTTASEGRGDRPWSPTRRKREKIRAEVEGDEPAED